MRRKVDSTAGGELDHLNPRPLGLSFPGPERHQSLSELLAGQSGRHAAHVAAQTAARHHAVRVDEVVVGLDGDEL